MLPYKLSLSYIASFLKEIVPEYEEMLAAIEADGGHFQFSDHVNQMIENLNIQNYPTIYRDQDVYNKLSALAVMSVEELNNVGAELASLPEARRTEFLEELFLEFIARGTTIVDSLPTSDITEEQKTILKDQFDALSPDDQKAGVKQLQTSLSSFFAGFFNTLTMMVHGKSLISLVTAAEAGDDDAFCIAVQMDKRILIAIPYFFARRSKAEIDGDIDFLDKLHYRLSNPFLRGKIRYRTLWLTFAVLDLNGYLDGSIKHREIVTIFNDTLPKGSKQYINDVGTLTKRLREYRRFQEENQKSRH